MWIQYEVFDDKRLSSSDKVVYMVLARHANNDTQTCFPSIETIEQEAGLTQNTVVRSLRKLEKLHIIDIKKEQGMSNIYQLNHIESKVTTRLIGSGSNIEPPHNEVGYPPQNEVSNNTNINNTKNAELKNSAYLSLFNEVKTFFYKEFIAEYGAVPQTGPADYARLKEFLKDDDHKEMTIDEYKELVTFYLKSDKAHELGATLRGVFTPHTVNLWRQQGNKNKFL